MDVVVAAGDPEKADTYPKDNSNASDEIEELVGPSLFRLTEGLPKHELSIMVSEAKACEAELLEEIRLLEEALKQEETKNSQADSDINTNTDKISATNPAPDPAAASAATATAATATKSSPVDIMLASEITPPDRYQTVSALLGRLRDPVATPLPPNSSLIAIRQQQQAASSNKKKLLGTSTPTPEQLLEFDRQERMQLISKQRKLLQLGSHPEYHRVHTDSAALLAVWKRVSSHRAAAVFRRPVNPKEAPGYTDRILFPIDLSLVRKMISTRIIKSYADLHQRIGLICHNCVKFNGRESDYGVVTREFEAYVDECITSAVFTATTSGATHQPMIMDPAKEETDPRV